ncbi:MAG: hypothetical protein V7L05_31980 [Nostoc sp.]
MKRAAATPIGDIALFASDYWSIAIAQLLFDDAIATNFAITL